MSATRTRNRPEPVLALSDIAEGQGGYVTAMDAARAEIDRHKLQRLAAQGILERIARGLYRFTSFPRTDHDDFWRAVLWPTISRPSPRAILVRQSALDLWDVSTINPSKIDVAVAPDVRIRRREVPESFRIIRARYPVSQLTTIDGLPVTTLFQTLSDLIADRTALQFVWEVLDGNLSAAVLTRDQRAILRERLASESGGSLATR